MAEQIECYENRSLFSDYYLENRMADHPQWEEDVSDVFQQIQSFYQDQRDHLKDLNEAQTEEEFIRPVLNILGFTWDVQTKVEHRGRHNYPDYTLFQDESSKKEAVQHRDDPGTYYQYALALTDAKYWGRPLDQHLTDPREEYTNRNPSFQIVNYLTATGLDWGIITNGAEWRLYSLKARSRVDTYYEVNLRAILEQGLTVPSRAVSPHSDQPSEHKSANSASSAVSAEQLHAFKYFYHFFRAAAFIKDPETEKSFLDQVFDGSVNYGSRLQSRLKHLIFDRIFVHLAEGFIAHQRQTNPSADSPSRAVSGESDQASEDKSANSPDASGTVNAEDHFDLEEIYQGTLRLLYRLLFILYAEARDLLPVRDEHGYRNYSLMALKRRAANAVEEGKTLSGVGQDYWNDLQSLFRIIDIGHPDLNVPRYNGGPLGIFFPI